MVIKYKRNKKFRLITKRKMARQKQEMVSVNGINGYKYHYDGIGDCLSIRASNQDDGTHRIYILVDLKLLAHIQQKDGIKINNVDVDTVVYEALKEKHGDFVTMEMVSRRKTKTQKPKAEAKAETTNKVLTNAEIFSIVKLELLKRSLKEAQINSFFKDNKTTIQNYLNEEKTTKTANKIITLYENKDEILSLFE